MNAQDIRSSVKSFILNEFLPGEDPAALSDETGLITTGILDSIALLKVVSFLEAHFGITLAAHEASADGLNTIADIERLVASKLLRG